MSFQPPRRVYKIIDAAAFAEARDAPAWPGALIDRADGYIHFSTHAQLVGTLAAHFAGRDDLWLVAFDAEAFGAALRWESSRGGDLFPHLYAPLDMTLARSVAPLVRDAAGRHIVPDEDLA